MRGRRRLEALAPLRRALGALCLLALLTGPWGLRAQVAGLESGEFEGYSRLVMNIGAGARWQFGRTEDGYELRLQGAAALDLRPALQNLTQARIAALWTDPETGALRLRSACACHALPFEFQPGVLVIDLRDGPAPNGSSFEMTLAGEALPPLSAPPPPRPRARPTDLAAAPAPALAPALGAIPAGLLGLPPETAPPEPAAAPVVAEAPPEAPPPATEDPSILAELEADLGLAPLETAPVVAEAAPPEPAPESPPPPDAAASGDAPAAYDWRALALGAPGFQPPPATPKTPPPPPAPLPGTAPGQTELRDALLRELGDGAARGVVQLELPEDEGEGAPGAMPADLALRVGEDLGLVILPGGKSGLREGYTETGESCPRDEALDLAAWSGEEPKVSMALAAQFEGLVGEFDRPDPAALERAARYLLYLGFGAELRQMIAAFDTVLKDQAQLMALSYLVDGEADASNHFLPYAACDSFAALWAALSVPDLKELPNLNRGAVLRGFSGLPPHLRAALGPSLADKFMALGDTEAARILNEAVLRLPFAPPPEVQLSAAKVDLALGDTRAATQSLAALSAENTPATPEALIALVTQRVAAGRAMSPEENDSIEALMAEHRGTDLAPRLHEALVLAKASRGEFDAAFALAAEAPGDYPDLWHLLATLGPDEAVLTYGVLPSDAPRPMSRAETQEAMAARLVALGLSESALFWAGPVSAAEESGALAGSPALRQSQAAAAALRHDGLAVLAALDGVETPEAAALRAAAQLQIGETRAAQDAFAALGDGAEAARAARLARDWRVVAEGVPVAAPPEGAPAAPAAPGADLWASAARFALPPGSVPVPASAPAEPAPPAGAPVSEGLASPAPGPLAEGRALVEDAAAARAALDALLAAVPKPAPLPVAEPVAPPP
jgi:hypothetical protein